MKKYLIIYSIIFLVVLIFIFYKLYSMRQTAISLQNKVQSEIYEVRSLNTMLREHERLSIISENIVFDKSLIQNLSIGKYPIFLRLHENICVSCYTDIFNLLQKEFENNSINVTILGSYRYNSVFDDVVKQIGFNNCSTFNMGEDLNLPADSARVPYLFRIDNENEIHNIFFLQKNNRERVENYIQMMVRIKPSR